MYDTKSSMMIFVICKHCEEHLAEKGEIITELFQEFCRYFIITESCMVINPKLHKRTNTIVKYLETKGYITTMDCPELSKTHIKIRPNGLIILKNNLIAFCPRGCKHKQEII